MADHNEDLDELLDSLRDGLFRSSFKILEGLGWFYIKVPNGALDDFHSRNLTSSSSSSIQRSGDAQVGKQESSSFSPAAVQGLGMGLPDLRSKKRGKQKVSMESHVSEALEKLREQTRETVKGIESRAAAKPTAGDDLGKDTMMEDWVKQFEELAGSQDMESMVETMMQQLLSKDILHEPMKEIGDKYPKWLKEHENSLSKEEYEQYYNQYKFIKELNEVYEKDPGNFTKIVELMQKMQECGQPPNDIVRDLDPDFDISSLGQLSPEMLQNQADCCIL